MYPMRFILPMLLLGTLCAQAQEPPRPARPEPKNLKILKPDQLMPAMRSYTAGLGVKCDYCHIQGDFASDENRHKITARRMIEMTQQINTHFGGEAKERVTCYTCHRGEAEPKTAPPAAGQ